MSKLAISVLGVLLALVISASTAGGADSPVTPPPTGPAKADADGDKLFDDLELKLATLAATDSLRVVVVLNQAATVGAIDALQAQSGASSSAIATRSSRASPRQ